MSAECVVNRNKLLRDISFHIASITCVAIVGLVGYVNIFVAFAFFTLYGVYVYLVVSEAFTIPEQTQDVEARGYQLTGLQTAFWHGDAMTKKSNILSAQQKLSTFPVSLQKSNAQVE